MTSTQCLCWGGPQKGQTWGHSIPLCSAWLPAFWAKGIFQGNHPCFQASFQKKKKHKTLFFWQPLGYGRSLLTSSAGTCSGRHHPLMLCPHQQKNHCNSGKHPKFWLFIYRPAPVAISRCPPLPASVPGQETADLGLSHPCAWLLWGLRRLPQTLPEEPQTVSGHFGVRCLSIQSNFGVF